MTKQHTTLWEAYQLTVSLHWRGTRNEDQAVGNFAQILLILGKDYPVDRIDNKVVGHVVATLKRRGLSNSTVNRKLSSLGRVLRTAHQAGMRKDPPPSGLRLRENPHRTRVLTDEEVTSMLGALRPPYGDLAGFLLETGLRVSEALSVKWVDVHTNAVLISVNKADLPRTVPLTPEAQRILSVRRWIETEGPFASLSQSAFNHAWVAARIECGIGNDEEFVPHALRHTCASRLVSAGVPLAVVQKWLGHRNIKTTMQYAHLGDSTLMEAALRVGSLRKQEHNADQTE